MGLARRRTAGLETPSRQLQPSPKAIRPVTEPYRLGPWSSWSECEARGSGLLFLRPPEAVNAQRYRRRSVEVAPSYGGDPCDLHLIMPGTSTVRAASAEDRGVLRVGRLL